MNYVSQMSSNNYQAADFKPLESIRKCPRKALPKMCAKKVVHILYRPSKLPSLFAKMHGRRSVGQAPVANFAT